MKLSRRRRSQPLRVGIDRPTQGFEKGDELGDFSLGQVWKPKRALVITRALFDTGKLYSPAGASS